MASRTRNFIRSLGAGYISIAVNIAYTAASVPLALHYLGKEQFGLWALAQQIMGYLILLDLGVTSAVARFVADYKDDVQGGEYGSLLLTGAMVFAVQGMLIAAAGIGFSFFAPFLFAVPEPLAAEFRNVLIVITILAGVSVAFRSIEAPLWAFQRIDMAYTMKIITLILGFASLWVGFHCGWGIYSFAFSGIPAAFLCPAITFLVCSKNGFYPSRGRWGAPKWNIFLRVFSFGKDVFWMSLGSQFVNASQIMIISRTIGLDAAATFAIGTKAFTLFQQFTSKILESSAPALTEMFVRKEVDTLNIRFFNIIAITSFLATVGASVLVAGNTPLVNIWTSGVIHWTLPCDVLLGGLLIMTCTTRCLTGLFGIIGNLRPVRHIFFIEGCVFVCVAIPIASRFGIAGVLLTSLITHMLITGILSVRAVTKANLPMIPIFQVLFFSLAVFGVASVLRSIFMSDSQPFFQAFAHTMLLVFVAVFFGFFLILPKPLLRTLREKFCIFKIF
jgi:O-antigen/teichoic acid export membrane protein